LNQIVFKQSGSPLGESSLENNNTIPPIKKKGASPGRTSPTINYLPYNYQQQAHYIKGHQAQIGNMAPKSEDLMVVMP
jgi:hypothetical protein